MDRYLRSVLLATLLIGIDYGLILFMRTVTPKIIWLRSILIYLIFQLSLLIYYRLVRPAHLNRFTAIIIVVFSFVTILLTLLQHTILTKDISFFHLIPLGLIIITILLTHIVYGRLGGKD
jgi:hypothetical protein